MFEVPELDINWSFFNALGVLPELNGFLCFIYEYGGKDKKNSFCVFEVKVTVFFL